MRKAVWIALLCMAIGASAQQDTLKYRIMLADKAGSAYSVEHPEQFLSEKAIARRQKQGIAIDETDLPVSEQYLQAIRSLGVKVVAMGKWENFVTVSCNDTTLIDQIARFPFVTSTMKVWELKKTKKPQFATKRDSIEVKEIQLSDNLYGSAYQQISMSNGDKLHEAGFKGEGMTIAVIDGGFHNADIIPMLANVRVLGTKDFVNPHSDIYAETSHGMAVLACMAMNQPNVMIGTAPEASYWLLRTEDSYSEYPVEEDYAAAAIEFADSVGVDLINTSLGYYTFDDKTKDYRYRDLDGKVSLMSRTANRTAEKGMLLVCSAGNAGSGSWKKITPPGDAEHVITVGAIGKNGVLAPFSSVGNTTDNRIKPDVMAVGAFSDTMGTNGNLTLVNGTSFSSPIMCGMIACLWQALPQLTAKQMLEVVRQSGDNAEHPDNIYGYGVPDLREAYSKAK
ncbi:serine protease [Bacteroides sp. 214]|uniref:S8 family peptidase n=1 Tax=Bacteroides sp. 214 TaxID=2302935 RepID=UPI0013D4C564|nr:S8 family serine peptidase [Bacteroides sp. 214]NDW13163.1 serine protease [Bacteroides sp. 214]